MKPFAPILGVGCFDPFAIVPPYALELPQGLVPDSTQWSEPPDPIARDTVAPNTLRMLSAEPLKRCYTL